MAKRKDVPTRQEVSKKIEKNRKDMELKEINLDWIASDVETVRQTLEKLDFGGTAEGFDQVETSIKGAENVTADVFDREDEDLEQIQKDNQEYEGEIQDRRKSSESDLGKISDSSARIETKETINELIQAKEAALKDIDFLAEQIERAKGARDKSDSIQKRIQARVHSEKRSR